jgi:hypothetical protein
MKKITIAILATLFSYSIASAELGVSIGVSGQVGVFSASGTESEKLEKQSQDAHGVAGYTSFFIEKKLSFLPGHLSRLSIGFDHVADTLSSEEVSTARTDITGVADTSGYVPGVGATITNKAKIDFEDLNTTYLALNVTDSLYVKAGMVTVDVITKETLGTGSTYGNTSVDGTMLGIGFALNKDNGLFLRFEANHTEFDNAKVTASNADNFVEMKNLEGAMGKISVGKTF